MISYTELDNSQSLLDNALRLLCLEPMSVLGSDVVKKEICKSYHLFANDSHGIFGTAMLSERPIRTLSAFLISNVNFQGKKTYYELSLVYTKPPQNLAEDSVYDKNLSTRYSWKFYNELIIFLNKKLTQKTIVVRTTKKEAANMVDLGLWHLQDVSCQKTEFLGLLHLVENAPAVLQENKKSEGSGLGYSPSVEGEYISPTNLL